MIRRALLGLLLVALVHPLAAHAATITNDSVTGSLVYQAPADQSQDIFTLTQGATTVFQVQPVFHQGDITSATCTITTDPLTTIKQASCPIPTGAMVVNLGPGDDSAAFSGTGFTTTAIVDGGPGNDAIGTGPEEDHVAAGAGNDSVVSGDGNDTIDAGAGFDEVDAGAGDDVITVRDGTADRVQCGAGADRVIADSIDTLLECETADISSEFESDRDHDGVTREFDCADTDPAIHPGAVDVPDDGVDQDCDGQDARILDRDHDSFLSSVDDCNDNDPAIHPGTAEVYGNAIDENCDGVTSPYRVIYPGVSTYFVLDRHSRITRVSKLQLSLLTTGTRVRTTCRGRGCPPDSRRTTRRTTVDLTKALASARLRPGARLTVWLTRSDSMETAIEFTAHATSLPTPTIVCRRPGSSKKIQCSLPA